jgi:site-specific DNA recombinase
MSCNGFKTHFTVVGANKQLDSDLFQRLPDAYMTNASREPLFAHVGLNLMRSSLPDGAKCLRGKWLRTKTDRLYRNFKDLTTLDDFGATVHLVKEGRVIGPHSRSSDQLVHGINVLMARNYILNLSEETRKGMLEKARSGVYPGFAPVGYRNADGPSGKRNIVSDPDTAPVIAELFQQFATGQYSLKALVGEFNAGGVKLRGRKLYSSVVHQILRKRLYTGDFDWDGETYAGIHEPLVPRECWQRVQELLNARAENKIRKVKHDFAYTGLVHCGHCGCVFVGELKKGKYVYYHCTGNRGKCPEPYTRQEVLTREFAGLLRELVIPPPILEWLSDAVLSSDQTEQAARAQAIKKLQAPVRSHQNTHRDDVLGQSSTGASARSFSINIRLHGVGSRMVCCARFKTSTRPRPPQ